MGYFDPGDVGRDLRMHLTSERAADPDAVPTAPDMHDRVRQAHRLFLSRTYAKLMRAADLAVFLEAPGSADIEAVRAELREIAHSIAGNSGSFGYHRLSELAEKLEAALDLGHFDRELTFDLIVSIAAEFLRARTT